MTASFIASREERHLLLAIEAMLAREIAALIASRVAELRCEELWLAINGDEPLTERAA